MMRAQPTTAPFRRLVVLSPHLDDAALSCSYMLADHPGAIVVTVFAGAPGDGVSYWDRCCGFGDGDNPIACRRAEDRQALALLGATPRWLDHRDHAYGGPRDLRGAADSIVSLIEQTCSDAAVLLPLGLVHADHVETRRIALAVMARCSATRWFVYEDLPYGLGEPLAVEAAIATFSQAGFGLRPAIVPRIAASRKQEALACYRSQMPALAERVGLAMNIQRDGVEPAAFVAGVLTTERYWWLSGRSSAGASV